MVSISAHVLYMRREEDAMHRLVEISNSMSKSTARQKISNLGLQASKHQVEDVFLKLSKDSSFMNTNKSWK